MCLLLLKDLSFNFYFPDDVNRQHISKNIWSIKHSYFAINRKEQSKKLNWQKVKENIKGPRCFIENGIPLNSDIPLICLFLFVR